jgi:hypothetical protein
MNEEQIKERATRWAALYRNPKSRPQMDDVLRGLNEAGRTLVILGGQRIAGGLPWRLASLTERKEVETNGNSNKTKGRRPASATAGAKTAKAKVSVGAHSSPQKTNHRRTNAGHKK